MSYWLEVSGSAPTQDEKITQVPEDQEAGTIGDHLRCCLLQEPCRYLGEEHLRQKEQHVQRP